MKRFLTKLFFFTLMVGASVYFLLLKADGYTDPFYIRFITPKQKNLIIGSSRAAQGLQPDIFKEVLKRSFFNYCFSIDHSPFGSVYLESIKKKLDSKTSDQLFIVTVDPWSISSQTNDPNNSSEFREVNLCLDNTKFVNINPNPFYLFNNTDGKYYKLLYKGSNLMFLHDNGWLEISLDMDSISVEKRLERKIEAYREKHLPVYKFSSTRVKYLIETIQ